MKKILFMLLLLFLLFFSAHAGKEVRSAGFGRLKGSSPAVPPPLGLERTGVEKLPPAKYNALRGCTFRMAGRPGHSMAADDPGRLLVGVLPFLGER